MRALALPDLLFGLLLAAGLAVEPAEAGTEALGRADSAEGAGPGAAGEAQAPAGVEDAWPDRIDGRLDALAARAGREPSAVAVDDTLSARIAPLLARLPRATKVAVHVRDLETGRTVLDVDGDTPLNPASSHKLLSIAAAIELLGADYRFETRVLRLGDDLILVGEGDPDLQVDDLYRLAEIVAASGRIAGVKRILIDDRAFDHERFAPGYDPLGPGFSYMAPSGALSLQFNTLEIAIGPGEPGQAAAVSVDPPNAHVEVVSRARTGPGAAATVASSAAGARTRIEISGAIGPDAAPIVVRRRIHDPGAYTAAVFADLLGRQLDAAPLPVERDAITGDGVTIATHLSDPLGRAAESGLKFSNNFVAEQLLRTLAWRATARPGSFAAGVALLRRFWSALGQDPAALACENGSGLSRNGRATARGLVAVLGLLARDDDPAAALLPALPTAGRDGTLHDRLDRTERLVRAKTGTMSGVSALAGLVGTESGGSRLAFGILVNGEPSARRSHALQDEIVLALLDHARTGS